eukprot:TRINITY_DN10732_c0_g1_i1.p1 TRINITY_DN10732_c0_g1~~TRINITY_DN10732_c0_g1_i1.p1  ORF type:complete len:166 (-),score=45.53 TRINITY_DN10732_c0_g1_i1:45-542(-)
MLKVSKKRNFDFYQEMNPDDNNYPSAETDWMGRSLNPQSPPLKKKRRTPMVVQNDACVNPGVAAPSPFHRAQWSMEGVNDEMIMAWMPKRKRSKFVSSSYDDKIFSTKDLYIILNKAIEETKQQLKSEYNEILHENLKEQNERFLVYTRDHIHNQLEETAPSYIM